jgi:hypothetical protein
MAANPLLAAAIQQSFASQTQYATQYIVSSTYDVDQGGGGENECLTCSLIQVGQLPATGNPRLALHCTALHCTALNRRWGAAWLMETTAVRSAGRSVSETLCSSLEICSNKIILSKFSWSSCYVLDVILFRSGPIVHFQEWIYIGNVNQSKTNQLVEVLPFPFRPFYIRSDPRKAGKNGSVSSGEAAREIGIQYSGTTAGRC